MKHELGIQSYCLKSWAATAWSSGRGYENTFTANPGRQKKQAKRHLEGLGLVVPCSQEFLFFPISKSQYSRMNYVGSENECELVPIPTCILSLFGVLSKYKGKWPNHISFSVGWQHSSLLPNVALWLLVMTGSYCKAW
jgi:hypothetical protein